MNQQDKDKSSQKFKTGSSKIQEVYDGRLVLEASKEVERSYLSKTNSLLMNAGTTPDKEFVTIGAINGYIYDQ